VKKLAIAALALGGLVSFAAGAAHADPAELNSAGFTCGFSSSDDPTGAVANPGTQVGELDGGPIAVADLPNVDTTTTPPTVTFDTGGNPASATITCALQVGGTGLYTDADAVSASASGTVVAYLPPTLVSYQASATDPVWSCTTWTLTDAHGASQTLYLDDTSGNFLTDPAAAHCALAISQQIPPQEVCDAAPPACDTPVVKP
jgi:hypothetical protein